MDSNYLIAPCKAMPYSDIWHSSQWFLDSVQKQNLEPLFMECVTCYG